MALTGCPTVVIGCPTAVIIKSINLIAIVKEVLIANQMANFARKEDETGCCGLSQKYIFCKAHRSL